MFYGGDASSSVPRPWPLHLAGARIGPGECEVLQKGRCRSIVKLYILRKVTYGLSLRVSY
jgi:hypothetical protein